MEGSRLLPKNLALSATPPPTSLPEDMLSKNSLNCRVSAPPPANCTTGVLVEIPWDWA